MSLSWKYILSQFRISECCSWMIYIGGLNSNTSRRQAQCLNKRNHLIWRQERAESKGAEATLFLVIVVLMLSIVIFLSLLEETEF